MSTHYSAPPRQIQVHWGIRFFVFVAAPVALVAIAANAWADGLRPWAMSSSAVANAYIAICVAHKTSKKSPSSAYFGIVAAEGALLAVYLTYAQPNDITLISFVWTIAGLFAIGAFVSMHHTQLKRLTQPIPTSTIRAIDYPGIYRITCSANQMEYIGQTSRAIRARWHDHESDLNAGRHHNPRMQLDWNKYGAGAFIWEVLEVVTDPVWLYDRERWWQNMDYETTRRYNPPNTPRGK
jgi:hypothetical protein